MRNKHFHSSREAKLFPNTCYKTAALGDAERHDGKISQYRKYGHKAGFVFVFFFKCCPRLKPNSTMESRSYSPGAQIFPATWWIELRVKSWKSNQCNLGDY